MLQYSTTVSNLGVLLDTQLTMADHIAAACRSGFFQLRPVLRCYDNKLLSYLILAYQTVIDAGFNEDTGTCLHRQSPELLQPTLCWGQWPVAGQAAVPPEGCSALHPSGVAKSSTSFGWGKGWNVTSDGWQATLCDPIWHVSSSSGEACCELLYPVTTSTTTTTTTTAAARLVTGTRKFDRIAPVMRRLRWFQFGRD